MVAFAVIALAAVAGCHSSSGSTGATDNPVVGSTNAASSPATAASSGPATPRRSAGSGSASTAPSQATTAAAGGAAHTAAPATKAPGTPTGHTRPGHYTYDLSGSATQPLRGTQQVSGAQSYVVDPAQGATQHSRTSDSQGSTDQTLSVRATGLYVQDIRIAMQGFTEDFHPVGTALYFPASYHAGSHWSWRARSTDGKYQLDVASKVASSAKASVVVDTTLHISGSGFDITVQQRDWVSTTYALILKEHSVTKGTAYGAAISSDVTRKLRSTTPS